MDFRVDLDIFRGPLDLLLYLVRKHEVEITEIPIAVITNQYLEYLEILNDGGLVAGVALLLFLVLVMRHGWQVIRNEQIDRKDRVLASTAFSALVGILLASFFFFSFRINTTLFMTVLMMGMLEGLYLQNAGKIQEVSIPKSATGKALIPVVFLVLVGLVWYTGIRPFKSEQEHFAYKLALQKNQPQQAEKHLLRALEYDPHNSAYCLYAAQLYINVIRNFPKANEFIERAILDYNGDITRWAVFYLKGILKFQSGSLFEARAAFEKALFYNPEFDIARQKLNEVNQVIKDHDRVMIKFR
jgi:tetratricopeptide (TPR) repeat protein